MKWTHALTEAHKHKIKLLFKRLQIVIVVLILLAFVLYRLQRNVTYEVHEARLELLSQEKLDAAPQLAQKPRCLILWDDDYQAQEARKLMEETLGQMKTPYDSMRASQDEQIAFDEYDSVVLCLDELNSMGDNFWTLLDWTESGGHLMFTFLPTYSAMFDLMRQRFGIREMGNTLQRVQEFCFPKPLMLGGEGRSFGVTDAYDSSFNMLLDDECEVFMESGGDDPVPLIWRRTVREGCAVMVNLNYLERAFRGVYGAAYSLLGDAFAWPVINGSAFYLDDFPSPVPGGEGKYIQQDFNMNIEDFYTHVWWADELNLAKKYGIRYTGLVIEEYSDQVEGELEVNKDTSRYLYFGNMLLDAGGEIGFHGYNHMPLVLSNFDYRGEYDTYLPWVDEETMQRSIAELNRFCASLYPKEAFQVYVPPSNILSDEGRAMLAADFPNIRVIASTYLEGDLGYMQEFEVADDGIVETPRVISGCIMDDYTRVLALSELTMHYVNTHFQHPDDVLDEDRGAELGWKEMFSRLTDYVDWLYTAAPDIRNLTGSELAAAVQRYDALQVKQCIEDGVLRIDLGGFVDEAYLLVRLNGKTPGETSGGELEQLMDGLYLLRADDAHIEIGLR